MWGNGRSHARVSFAGERVVYLEYKAPAGERASFKQVSIRNGGFWEFVTGTASSDMDTYRVYETGEIQKMLDCYVLTTDSVCEGSVLVGQV